MNSNAILRFAGAPADAAHDASAAARSLYVSIATVLVITGIFAAAGAASFAQAYFVTPDMASGTRVTITAVVALLWASIIVALDRSLIVLADAAGKGLARWAMLAFRTLLALFLSWLVSDQIILWFYRAPIADAAQKLSLEARESARKKLDAIHDLAGKEKAAVAGEIVVSALRAERDTLPQNVLDLQAGATRCASEREAMSKRYATLRDRAAEDDRLASALASLGQAIANKRRDCARQSGEAAAAKAEFYRDKDAAIEKARTAATEAGNTLSASKRSADEESARAGSSSAAMWSDGSSRQAAFERVKAERPDIRRAALVLWIVLLVIELAPLLAKSLAVHNPIAAEAQRQLQEDASRNRMKAAQTAQFEMLYCQTLAGDAAVQEAVKQILAAQNAAAPLHAFDHLLQQSEGLASRVRRQARDPNFDALHTAFLEAQARAFERLTKSYS